MGKQWKQCQTLFFWAPQSLQMVTAAMKLKDSWEGGSGWGTQVQWQIHVNVWQNQYNIVK